MANLKEEAHYQEFKAEKLSQFLENASLTAKELATLTESTIPILPTYKTPNEALHKMGLFARSNSQSSIKTPTPEKNTPKKGPPGG